MARPPSHLEHGTRGRYQRGCKHCGEGPCRCPQCRKANREGARGAAPAVPPTTTPPTAELRRVPDAVIEIPDLERDGRSVRMVERAILRCPLAAEELPDVVAAAREMAVQLDDPDAPAKPAAAQRLVEFMDRLRATEADLAPAEVDPLEEMRTRRLRAI